MIACTLLTACASISYTSPDSTKISDALDGAVWPSGIPAPAYIDKFMAKFDAGYVEIYFQSVTKNELTAYTNALRTAGFKLTPVVYQFNAESIAKERAARGDYDYYEAEKGSLEMHISAKPGPYDTVYISIWGLSDQETAGLKVQSMAEEIEELGGFEIAGFGTRKEYLIDIGNSLEGQIQPEINTSNPVWLSVLPAPSFIDRISKEPGSIMQSYLGEGIALSFDEIDMQEIIDYLILLKSKGYMVVQPIYYEYFENAKPHGALDYQNYAAFHAKTDSYNGSLEIRAENERYMLTFSLDRNYIVQNLFKGDDDYISLYQNNGPLGLILNVTGLCAEEMQSIGFEPYVYDNSPPPAYVDEPPRF